MHGDLETLYDAHAHRLYAHCWSLLGDRGAADALRDTLIRAMRNPPRGDTVLGLHRLARTVCAERGAFGRRGRPVFAQAAIDPLLAAVGDLSAGRREALLLSAGQWLEVRDIAAVLDISPAHVRGLLHEARTALERFVLDVLLRGNADPGEHMDVIAAFEKGRLPHLLARRAATWAPAPLRDQVLAAADREHDRAGREHDGAGACAAPAATTGPLVLIDSASEAGPAKREHSRRRAAVKAVGGVTGVAATVAAGLVMTWPSAGGGTVSAFGPYEGGARSAPVPTGGVTDGPGVRESPNAKRHEAAPTPAPTPTTATEQQPPVTEGPAPSGGGATTSATTPEQEAPATSSAPSPTSRVQTPPASPKSPEPAPDEGSPDNPLEPITNIVGHLTSPLLGTLSGR